LKSILSTVVILILGLVAFATEARAQDVSAYLGFGSAHDSSNGSKIETFSDGTLYRTPSLGGFFMALGASVFVNKQVGIGADLSWRTPEGDYAGLKYRPSFYSFDGIYRPARWTTKRLDPELRAGIGGARVRYSFNDQAACDQVRGCPESTHFQVHLGVATRIYVADHIFLRPAVDVHYVNNFSEFGSNWVPQYSIGVGYGFGR
jgi:Outer membrane protein beta-barrel domain